MERALAAGEQVLIENLEESVDPVLGPLLGREMIKKGRYIKIGDKECEYNPAFRLILHTKLANPHFQPELQAQCTLINFTVTRDGLEDQLLATLPNQFLPWCTGQHPLPSFPVYPFLRACSPLFKCSNYVIHPTMLIVIVIR
uniref:Dynein heavy chain ATP-binding dynein motor region domain-containing protein n=1 Tax=Anas platyrhynchos platyrhynchos TaxID=8840 RepID=A0A493T3E0_ANAPP